MIEPEMDEDEAAEAKERLLLLTVAADIKRLRETAGWTHIEKWLRERPAAIAMHALDSDEPKEYSKGRLDESRWLMDEIERIEKDATTTRAASEEKRRMEAAAVREFIGRGRGGGLA